MLRFVLRRVAIGVILVWIVVTLIFLALHMVPGDPAALLLSGDSGGAPSPEALEHVRESLGLNQPLLTQYGDYLAGLVQLDLGSSFRDGSSVSAYIGSRLPNTMQLVLGAALIAAVVGVPLGALAARKGGVVDSIVSFLTTLGVAVPVYVVGTVFVLVFALKLNLVSAGGFIEFQVDPMGNIERAILPTVAISLSFTSVIARMTRSSVLETMGQDWVKTARSVGLSRSHVFGKHVVRNSLNPVATSFGLEIGTLIGSTVLIERVFNWPGLGTLLVDSVLQRDYPVVQGIVIVVSILFILINILVDISYALLDPRVRQ
ncbi:ABC transporter permease [Paramicrobacterium agarici]|uniref:ABC transporter permease n=1 Tax=Paramicrobacterium agarici TaxID=630514 RepID=UPI00116B5F0D|nr:ABC transporter permease [Microbacterium agarici]TQO22950.1 peptide/nickel transport system permease protein [Microbacterium agarici]